MPERSLDRTVRRRRLLVAVASFAASLASDAQTTDKVYRIGYLSIGSASSGSTPVPPRRSGNDCTNSVGMRFAGSLPAACPLRGRLAWFAGQHASSRNATTSPVPGRGAPFCQRLGACLARLEPSHALSCPGSAQRFRPTGCSGLVARVGRAFPHGPDFARWNRLRRGCQCRVLAALPMGRGRSVCSRSP